MGRTITKRIKAKTKTRGMRSTASVMTEQPKGKKRKEGKDLKEGDP